MKTEFLLLARYDGRVIIPIEDVCRDFFSHLSPAAFIRKANEGELTIPVIRMDGSAKTARGVHLVDLAAYVDERRAAAIKENRQLGGRISV